MARTVSEWIGRNDDAQPTSACKRRILDRQNDLCAITGLPFDEKNRAEFDHIVPLWLGGQNRETNLHAIRPEPHRRKTATEATVRAKVHAAGDKHRGIARKPSKPFPGGKQSKWKRRIDGTVVLRDQEAS